jgi:hypothetical protein
MFFIPVLRLFPCGGWHDSLYVCCNTYVRRRRSHLKLNSTRESSENYGSFRFSPRWSLNLRSCGMLTPHRLVVQDRGPPKGGGVAAGLQAPKSELKKKFRIHDDIKRFTWFILQPKSATEIGWLGFWKIKQKTKDILTK